MPQISRCDSPIFVSASVLALMLVLVLVLVIVTIADVSIGAVFSPDYSPAFEAKGSR